MNPTLDELIGSALTRAKELNLSVDALDVADAIFLLAHLELPTETSGDPDSEEPLPPDRGASTADGGSKKEGGRPPADPEPDCAESPSVTPPPSARAMLPSASQARTAAEVGAIEFGLADARAVPNLRFLARALRYMPSTAEDPTRKTLDVEATISLWSEKLLLPYDLPLLPVMKPMETAWAEISLVVDRSPTMGIWREAVEEIVGMLQWQGAFRSVKLWEIDADAAPDPNGEDGLPRIYAVGAPFQNEGCSQPRPYRELCSARRDRLVVILTDANGSAWRDGRMFRLLQRLGASANVTILHTLPEKLWGQTTVGVPPWLVTSSTPRPDNRQLLARPRPGVWNELDDPIVDFEGAMPIPVVALDETSLRDWSRMQAGLGRSAVPALVLRPDLEAVTPDEVPDSDEEVLNRFFGQATPTAQRLARYFTVVPLTVPIFRLAQRAMEPKSNQGHLAEVLASGLLVPAGEDDEGIRRFEWRSETVRATIAKNLSGTERRHILSEVGESLRIPPETIRRIATDILTGDGSESDAVAKLTSAEREFAYLSAQAMIDVGLVIPPPPKATTAVLIAVPLVPSAVLRCHEVMSTALADGFDAHLAESREEAFASARAFADERPVILYFSDSEDASFFGDSAARVDALQVALDDMPGPYAYPLLAIVDAVAYPLPTFTTGTNGVMRIISSSGNAGSKLIDGLGGVALRRKDGTLTIGDLFDYVSLPFESWHQADYRPSPLRDAAVKRFSIPEDLSKLQGMRILAVEGAPWRLLREAGATVGAYESAASLERVTPHAVVLNDKVQDSELQATIAHIEHRVIFRSTQNSVPGVISAHEPGDLILALTSPDSQPDEDLLALARRLSDLAHPDPERYALVFGNEWECEVIGLAIAALGYEVVYAGGTSTPADLLDRVRKRPGTWFVALMAHSSYGWEYNNAWATTAHGLFEILSPQPAIFVVGLGRANSEYLPELISQNRAGRTRLLLSKAEPREALAQAFSEIANVLKVDPESFYGVQVNDLDLSHIEPHEISIEAGNRYGLILGRTSTLWQSTIRLILLSADPPRTEFIQQFLRGSGCTVTLSNTEDFGKDVAALRADFIILDGRWSFPFEFSHFGDSIPIVLVPTTTMWERFNPLAQKVVFYAQEEALKYKESFVSTEQLLLGLVHESDHGAALVLRKLGVSLNSVRAGVEKYLVQNNAASDKELTLTPRAKRVIDLTYDETRNLNNNYIGPEHLLLGLIRERDGLAGRVLNDLGIELEEARREVIALQLSDTVDVTFSSGIAQVPVARSISHLVELLQRDTNSGPDALGVPIWPETDKDTKEETSEETDESDQMIPDVDVVLVGNRSQKLESQLKELGYTVSQQRSKSMPSLSSKVCIVDKTYSWIEKASNHEAFIVLSQHKSGYVSMLQRLLGDREDNRLNINGIKRILTSRFSEVQDPIQLLSDEKQTLWLAACDLTVAFVCDTTQSSDDSNLEISSILILEASPVHLNLSSVSVGYLKIPHLGSKNISDLPVRIHREVFRAASAHVLTEDSIPQASILEWLLSIVLPNGLAGMIEALESLNQESTLRAVLALSPRDWTEVLWAARRPGNTIPLDVVTLLEALSQTSYAQLFHIRNSEIQLVGSPPKAAKHPYTKASWDGLIGQAARSGEAIYVPDVDKVPNYIAAESTTASELVIPILSRAGVPRCVLNLESSVPNAFSTDLVNVLKNLSTGLGEYLDIVEALATVRNTAR